MSLVIKLTSLLIFNVIQNLLNLITLFSIFGALPALPVKLRVLFAEKKTLAVFGDQRAAVAIFATTARTFSTKVKSRAASPKTCVK